MCSVRDRWDDYVATGAEVVGISSDSIESHRKFAEHHNLPLRLLSDSEGTVSGLYGARSFIPGKVARSVFVIDSTNTAPIRCSSVGIIQTQGRCDDQAIKAAQKKECV